MVQEIRAAVTSRDEAAKELALQLDVAKACGQELVEEEKGGDYVENLCCLLWANLRLSVFYITTQGLYQHLAL